MNQLEMQLEQILTQIVIRYPDGWSRIRKVFRNVYEADIAMLLEDPSMNEVIKGQAG